MKKKILSIILSAAFGLGTVFAGFSANTMTTLAADAATVTHSYEAYEIFTGTYDSTSKTFSDIKFGTGTTAEMIAALDTELGITAPDADADKHAMQIAKALETQSAKAEKVAQIISKNLSAVKVPVADLAGKTGYYLIVDVTDLTGDEEVYLDRAQLQVVIDGVYDIKEKRDTLESWKKVQDINDSLEVNYSEWQDSADYDIGDDIPFQISATVPADIADYVADPNLTYEYIFHDIQSAGLTFKADTVAAYLYDSKDSKTGTPLTKDVDFTVKTEGLTDDTFQIIFADISTISGIKAGNVIKVEYKSTLNESAKVGAVGNDNKMRIEFKNDKGGKGKTPWDTVIVFTFKTEINKVDEEQKPLEGAAFKLEKVAATLEGGKYVVTKDADDNDIVLKSYDITNVGAEFSSKGLDDGVYKITETTTPAGYNSIDPIYFVVVAEHDAEAADPKLTKIDVTDLSGKSIVATDAATGNLGEFVIEHNNEDAIDTTIINQHGAVLPSTGGIGTTIFYVIGGVLVVGAVVLLIVRRRMRNEEE